MDFGSPACSTCITALPLGTFLPPVPFLSASPIAYVSLLDYIATVSLADFLALWLVLFLSARSARPCRSREDVFLLRKIFLLIYNTTTRTSGGINNNLPTDPYTTTRTSDDLNENNNKLSVDSYITTRTSGGIDNYLPIDSYTTTRTSGAINNNLPISFPIDATPNNNNNNNRPCTIYNAIFFRLQDHGIVLYFAVKQLHYFNLQGISVDIAIALATAVAIGIVYFTIAMMS